MDGPSLKRPVEGTCSRDDCERRVKTCGLCGLHYQRLHASVPMDDPPLWLTKTPGELCSVKNCVREAKAKTLCSMHYTRLRQSGELGTAAPMKAARGEGHVDKHGYRHVRINGRTMLEHRLIMQELIGRPLAGHESVHHKNGKRSDNRPENLELWASSHRSGQRVQDLIAFVVENYPEANRAMLDGHQISLEMF